MAKGLLVSDATARTKNKNRQKVGKIVRVSERVRFYAVPTARVISTAKTNFDIFSLSREQVWTFLVLGDRIYEIRCLFVAVGLNALFIVLPHWDNMSYAHMLTHPVTFY